MPGTGANPGFGIKSLRDSSPEAYKDFSKDYLEKAYNIFEGDADKTLTSYNMGIPGVQGAVDKAKKSGGHWRDYIPKGEATNYYGKVIGKAQENLPPRQDMAGADTYEPAPVYDNAFLPRGATANDVGIMKNAPGSDKLGSAAYLIKEALKMREGKKEGGPIRLQAGSREDPISAGVRSLQDDPSNENTITLPDGRRVDIRELIETRNAESFKRATTPPDQERRNQRLDVQDKISRGMGEIGDSIKNRWDALPSRSEVYRQIEDLGRMVVDPLVKPSETIADAKRKFDSGSLPSDPQEKPNIRLPFMIQGMDYPKGVVNPPPDYPPDYPPPGQGGTIRNPADPDDIHQRMTPPQAKTISQAQAPVGASPAGTPIKAGPRAGPSTGPSTGAGSLAGQLAEIKSLMGTSLSNEATNIFARDEKILASMQNDKLVNTLMAASAVLAKQRVGSVNYGEAVATAGMAAQEAQGRIVKTEREMNKTRLELAAAQDDRDFKAITAAMNRLNQLDTTNTQLQVAVYAANRSAQAQEHSDERARLSQEGSNIRTEGQILSSRLNALVGERRVLETNPLATEQAKKDNAAEIASINSRLTALFPSRGSAGQTDNPTTPPAGFK